MASKVRPRGDCCATRGEGRTPGCRFSSWRFGRRFRRFDARTLCSAFPNAGCSRSAPGGIAALLGGRVVRRGAGSPPGDLGGGSGVSTQGLCVRPSPTPAALVLGWGRPYLAAVGPWPFRPILPDDLCAPLLIHGAEP